jgi:hypothetical protein
MVTKSHRGIKTTVEIPDDVWTAAKQRALDERSDLRAVIVQALRKHLRLKSEERPKKEARRGR